LLNWATLAVDNSRTSTAGNALPNVRLELAVEPGDVAGQPVSCVARLLQAVGF
jgi:hypothetical protein